MAYWTPGDKRHDPVAIKMGFMDAKPIRGSAVILHRRRIEI